MSTLRDIVDQLKSNNEKTDDVSSGVKELIALQTRNTLDDLEARKEAESKSNRLKNAPQKPIHQTNNNYGLLGLAALPSLFAPIIAGTTALGLAFAGLRGWEVPVIKSIGKGIKSLASSIPEGVMKLRDAALIKFFGFRDPSQIRIDPATGKFAKGLTLQEQVSLRMDGIRKQFLGFLGLGADGKPIHIIKKGKFAGVSTLGTIIDSARDSFMAFITPFSAIFNKIIKFSKAGLGLFIDAIKPIASGIGTFAKVVGKILKPIGVIFSLFEGISAGIDEQGPLINKLTAGFSAFVGDFVGSFLDLAKSGVSLLFEKVGMEELSKSLDSFSFEKILTNGIKSLLNWVVTIFTDPTQALDTALKTLLSLQPDSPKSFFDMFWMPFNKVFDWVSKKLTWREQDTPDFNLYDTIYNALSTITNFVSDIPTILKSVMVDVIADVKIAFAKFGGWISSIVPMIQLEGMRIIQGLPIVGSVISDDSISRAKTAIKAAQNSGNSTISRIEAVRKTGHDKIKSEREKQIKLQNEKAKKEEMIRSSSAQQVIDARSQSTNNSKTINLVGGSRPTSTDGPGGFY